MRNLYPIPRKSKAICIFAMLILTLSVSITYAKDSATSRLQTRNAKEQTIKAIKLADQNQWTNARKATADSRDPLASKLYYWLLFTQKEDVRDFGRFAHFVRNNPDWPGITAAKRKAERTMPLNLSAGEVIAWYKNDKPTTAPGVDRYMQALLMSGRTTQAREFIEDWWATTTLSRDDQRTIFKTYNQYISRAAHARRLDSILLKGQSTNARAIASVLQNGYPALTEARIALHNDKGNINALINRVPQHLQNDAGLRYERIRWRRKKGMDLGAAELLHNAPPASKVQNPEEWWQERHIIIRRMLEKKNFRSAYRLADEHIQKPGTFPYAQSQWLSGWLALRFLKQPTKALQHFEALHKSVESPISKARGAYWSGRAAQDIGNKDLARKWFKNAGQYQTTYYGQMAGDEIGLAQSLPNAAPPKLSAADIEKFDRNELVQLSNLFLTAGSPSQSGRFLRAFVQSEDSAKAYKYAVDLAIANKRNFDAVKISKEATKKGLFLTKQSYPVIMDQVRGASVEYALIHALIRQESQFDVNARSGVGARGLMQLMPRTAKETAGKMGIGYQQSWLTTRPDYNIKLGSRYMRDLLRRYDGYYPMAIAAYNAGPSRVTKWIKLFGDPRTGQISTTDWIELIPIYETRNYVQRVLEGTYVYRLRLRGQQSPPKNKIHVSKMP